MDDVKKSSMDGAAPVSPETQPKRKPYESPSILSEEIFETLALSCSKSGAASGCSIFLARS